LGCDVHLWFKVRGGGGSVSDGGGDPRRRRRHVDHDVLPQRPQSTGPARHQAARNHDHWTATVVNHDNTPYTVLVLGSHGVGKTTVIRQLMTSEYLANKDENNVG